MTDRHGLQNERTELAWQRTALAMVAGAALLARLHFDALGAWSLAGMVIVLGLGGWVVLEGRARYVAWGEQQMARPRDGRAAALLSIMIVVLAAIQLAGMYAGLT